MCAACRPEKEDAYSTGRLLFLLKRITFSLPFLHNSVTNQIYFENCKKEKETGKGFKRKRGTELWVNSLMKIWKMDLKMNR